MEDSTSPDYSKAIEIAPRIFWVGSYIAGDSFQCHSYLIENGDGSILIDPGSLISFPQTLAKVEQVIPFGHIKYFVCQHQDPDITASLPLIDSMINRPDAVIVAHWRSNALIKHYNISTPLECVEDMGWVLEDGDLNLRFILTPYLHFAGAFITFETVSKTLFSSDIFGSIDEHWDLYLEKEGNLEGIRLFHQHYMPSREILSHGIKKIRALEPAIIAPQHGSILTGPMMEQTMDMLSDLDCGLYLISKEDTSVRKLALLHRVLKDFLNTLSLSRDFSDIASQLFSHISEVLPLDDLSFDVELDDGTGMQLAKSNRYRPRYCDEVVPQNAVAIDQHFDWKVKNQVLIARLRRESAHGASAYTKGWATLTFDREISLDNETRDFLHSLILPLSVALERELIMNALDNERQRLYHMSMRDQLTNLYNRHYLDDAMGRLFAIQDREPSLILGVLLMDIDFFKSINDNHGHQKGDEVLVRLAQVVQDSIRTGDIAVRMGGDEILVITLGNTMDHIIVIGERIRMALAELDSTDRFSISAGASIREANETFDQLLGRVDGCLYSAKEQGRDCLVFAPD